MKRAILLVLGVLVSLPAADLKMFAPAVEFTQVEWLSATRMTGANLGGICEGRVTGWQELAWQGGPYDILSVKRIDTGAIEVLFSKGKLLMTRTPDGFYIVDVFPAEPTAATLRFKTTRKASAHDP
jgi:hypothetical protein